MIERLQVRIPAKAAGEFSSPELTLCADSCSVSVPPHVLPQWHVKDSGHSAKSAGGSLHLNTHTLLTRRSRSGLTMPLSRQSVGIYREKSSNATRQGTLGHSRLRSMSHCKLILAYRVEIVCAKAQAGNELPNILSKSSHARKNPPPPPPPPPTVRRR